MPLYRWQLRITADDGHTAVEDQTPTSPEDFQGTARELAEQRLSHYVAELKAGPESLPRVMRVVVWRADTTVEHPDGDATWER